MFLDWLLVGVLKLGLAGAAYATITGMAVGGIVPLVYFMLPNTSLLQLGRTKWQGRYIVKAAANGSSEFMSNVSMSIVNMLYNFQLMKYAGQRGVAAYGIIMYTNFIFIGCLFGYAMGAAPIASFNHGAANHTELKNVFWCSMKLIVLSSVIMTIASILAAKPLAMVFAGKNESLLSMTIHAIRIYSVCYLFAGINIFGSSFFTALNNGLLSALISFMRVLVLQVAFVMVLPVLFQINGIWMSIVMAELCALVITLICLLKNRDRYQYA